MHDVSRLLRSLVLSQLLLAILVAPVVADDESPCQKQLSEAADAEQYTYLMFFRSQDAATQSMQQTIRDHVEDHANVATLVSVKLDDAAEADLIEKYDATRMPMPVVVGIAPNGAVSGVYPQRVSTDQLERAILTPRYSEMVMALQQQKIAVVCLHPEGGGETPQGVTDFQNTPAFLGKTHLVSATADDADEAHFFERMHVPTDIDSPVVILFAPPGVYVGKFNEQSSAAVMAQRLHDSGRCNCERCRQHPR